MHTDTQATTQAPGPSTDATAQEKAMLGILFVHGIGEQKEGETLTAFGEPLIAWMRKWIDGRGKGTLDSVEVSKSILLPTKRFSTDPAHCTVNIRMTHRDTEADPIVRMKQQWLFAESWWGEQVQAPGVFSFIGWLFSRSPFVVFIHFVERAWQFTHPQSAPAKPGWLQAFIKLFTDTHLKLLRHIVWLYAALAFLFFTFFLQLFLLITGTLALIPIPAVRKYVLAVLRAGTQIVGDSYGFVANDTQRGAILTRLSENVEWLKSRCEKVVIIAHSQGAGVVYEAMREKHIDPPHLLVTFGAGIAKLSQLRRAEIGHRGKVAATGWIVPVLLISLLLLVYFNFGDGVNIDGKSGLLITIPGLIVGCILPAYFAWKATRTSSQTASTFQLNDDQQWLDLYASADPVPQGCLNDYLHGLKIDSERIINHRSFLGDHNAYWENKTTFVSRLVAALDRTANNTLHIPDLKESSDYQRAVNHHAIAIWIRWLASWLLLLSLFILSWILFDKFATVGKSLLDIMQSGPLNSVIPYIQVPAKFIEWSTMQLTGSIPGIYSRLGYAAFLVALLLLLAYLSWTVIAALLNIWSTALLDDFQGAPQEKSWGKYGSLLVWPFIALFAFIPLVITYALLRGVDPIFQSIQALTYLANLVLIVFIGLGMWQSAPKEMVKVKESVRKLTTELDKATTPGTNWGSLIVMPCIFAGITGLVTDKLGVKDAGTIAISLGYSIASLLLIVRLYRLCRLRELQHWIAWLVTSVPIVIVVIIFLSTTLIANERFAMSKSLLTFAGLTTFTVAMVYLLVARFSQPRKSLVDS